MYVLWLRKRNSHYVATEWCNISSQVTEKHVSDVGFCLSPGPMHNNVRVHARLIKGVAQRLDNDRLCM